MSRHDIQTEIETLTGYGLALQHSIWQFRAIIERVKFLNTVLSGAKSDIHGKRISYKYTNSKKKCVDKFGVEYESISDASKSNGINISVLRKDIGKGSVRFGIKVII